MKLFLAAMMIMMTNSLYAGASVSSDKNKIGSYTVANDPACKELVDKSEFVATFDAKLSTNNCVVSAAPTTPCTAIHDGQNKPETSVDGTGTTGTKAVQE